MTDNTIAIIANTGWTSPVVAAVAREMQPCEYCETQHYEEFVLRELLERSLIELNEDGTLDDLV